MNTAPNAENRPARNRATGKWTLLMSIVGLVCLLFVAIYFAMLGKQDTGQANVAAATPRLDPDKKNDTLPGGSGTEDYNAKVRETIERQQTEAEARKTSYVPPVVGKSAEDAKALLSPEPLVEVKPPAIPKPVEPPKPAPVRQDGNASKKPNKDPVQEMKALILKEMDATAQVTPFQVPVSMTFIPPVKEPVQEAEMSSVPPTSNGTAVKTSGKDRSSREEKRNLARTEDPGRELLPIQAGAILYANNDLHLNSDGGSVVRATVLTGSLKNFIALGQFKRLNQTLHLTFTRLVGPDGHEYPIKGLAIDPALSSENVASNVDNHYLSRWGGIAAGAFIEGLARATQNSGSTIGVIGSTTGVGNGTGLPVGQYPEWSMGDKALIAAGTVGQKFSQQLSRNFNRAPTVELYPGQAIGILILNADNNQTESTEAFDQEPVTQATRQEPYSRPPARTASRRYPASYGSATGDTEPADVDGEY